MKSFPFNLPDSLKSHLDLFEKDQEKATYMLERHLTRRGYDAVGYFLLGWFYLMQEKGDEALQCAIKARSYAPGSPFFMHLPYYFEHPALFDAWLPEDYNTPGATPSLAWRQQTADSSFFVDIDSLISRLSRRKQISPVQKKSPKGPNTPPPEKTAPPRRSEMATRTLALIYEQQQAYQKAIDVYKKLHEGSKDAAEKARFEDEIARLEDEMREQKQPPESPDV